ncbi:MAG: hypothetical protein HUJ98_07180 [Bacteroidaceae bacterium]|nr:hypothetical protein [Bacteroidaceae bacterium]
MKKTLTIILIFTMALMTTACVNKSPSDVVTSYLEAIKAQDLEKASSLVLPYEEDLYDTLGKFKYEESDEEAKEENKEEENNTENKEESTEEKEVEEDTNVDLRAEVLSLLESKIYDFDYEIIDEKINGKTAVVKVKFNTYKNGEAYESAADDYLSWCFSLDEDLSDNAMEKKYLELLKSKFEALVSKDREKTLDIKLTEVDGKWKIDNLTEGNPDLSDAWSGGYY